MTILWWLRWFGHVQRMPVDQIPHSVLLIRFEGERNNSRPRLCWTQKMHEYITWTDTKGNNGPRTMEVIRTHHRQTLVSGIDDDDEMTISEVLMLCLGISLLRSWLHFSKIFHQGWDSVSELFLYMDIGHYVEKCVCFTVLLFASLEYLWQLLIIEMRQQQIWLTLYS